MEKAENQAVIHLCEKIVIAPSAGKIFRCRGLTGITRGFMHVHINDRLPKRAIGRSCSMAVGHGR